MDRVILHSDANSFYASVECLYNPKIRNKPVVVGGNEENRHGIVLAGNQIAKKYGIKTAETLFSARQKCPNLVTIPAHYDLYIKFSKLLNEIYSEYTDLTESFGLDENWLDVTNSNYLFGSGEEIAEKIRKRVFYELGITVSIGVSFNKIFAKLGSDMKKPNAITVISKDDFKYKVWDLPVGDLLYVGRSTNERLRTLGVKTIGELAKKDSDILYSHLGKIGIVLHNWANGLDFSPVKKSDATSTIKSIGNSMTTHRDVIYPEDVALIFYKLADSVAMRLRENKLRCNTIQISIRDNKLISCERQMKTNYPTFLSSDIAETAISIFKNKYNFTNPVRSLGVRATNLIDKDLDIQIDLFNDYSKREKAEKLETFLDEMRTRYGNNIIQRFNLFEDKRLLNMNIKEDHIIHPTAYFEGAIL